AARPSSPAQFAGGSGHRPAGPAGRGPHTPEKASIMHAGTTRSGAGRMGAGLATVALLGSASVGPAAADEAGPEPVFWVVPVSKTTTTSPDRTIIVAEINIPP